MKTIWKYQLVWVPVQVIEMPGMFLEGNRDVITKGDALTVGVMNNEAFLWAMVDDNAPKVKRTIRMLWTGEQCNYSYEDYVGTVVNDGLVFHVFVE